FRRRLLLKRAAWRLGRGASVTEAALEAGYDAVEAFSRAFTRAYGVPPSRFATERRDFWLTAPNGIHFHPPGGLLLPGAARSATMDLSVSYSTNTGTCRASSSRRRRSLTR